MERVSKVLKLEVVASTPAHRDRVVLDSPVPGSLDLLARARDLKLALVDSTLALKDNLAQDSLVPDRLALANLAHTVRASKDPRLELVDRVQAPKGNLALDRLEHLDRVASKDPKLVLTARQSKPSKPLLLKHKANSKPPPMPTHRTLLPKRTNRVRTDSPATMLQPTWQH